MYLCKLWEKYYTNKEKIAKAITQRSVLQIQIGDYTNKV